MRARVITFFIVWLPLFVISQSLQVSENKRFLVKDDGTPFFWMADTAWELFHRCSKEQASFYLNKRKEQGFNVIQAVVLAELDGLNTPNVEGEVPLVKNNPETPNPKYFEHVDAILKMSDPLDMYIALLPTWGDKLFKNSWGVGPEIFNQKNALVFGKWLGNRYKNFDNIIWIIGGDRNPRPDSDDVEVWNAMAQGIVEGVGGNQNALMSFHPQPKDKGGSSTWFHNQEWLDFNMHQTGHCANQGTYEHIRHDYNLTPIKPVIDAEPLYEDHPNCFNAKELGHSLARDIRRIMYWNVFAGAFGQTYGCHDVWQMFTLDKEPINQPLRPWPKALEMPMATQVIHLKNLMLSRPFLDRIPFQGLVNEPQKDDNDYTIATMDVKGQYAMVYLPQGKPMTLNLTSLKGNKYIKWWYDPRTGHAYKDGMVNKKKLLFVTPPTKGIGNDWVLVLDDIAMKFPPPGTLN